MARIGIDARFYGTEHTGLGRYTMNVLMPLTQFLKDHELVVFLRSPYATDLKFGSHVEVVHCQTPHYSLSEQIILPFLAHRHHLDHYFAFHFNIPLLLSIPFSLVIHDLIKTHSKGKDTTTRAPWLYSLKRLGYNLTVSHAIRLATRIVVPSNCVKNDLLARYDLEPSLIRVIWEAPDPALQDPTTTSIISGDYLLFVGNAYPHKNLSTLLQAFAQTPSSLRLVLVTASTPYLTRLLKELKPQLRKRLIIKNSLTDQELASLYRHARALVAPSLMEGFGLPGLEALVLGTPVIAADIPVFHEVYGQHATYFPTKNSRALSHTIHKVLTQKRPTPLNYSQSWENVANDVAEVLSESCASL